MSSVHITAPLLAQVERLYAKAKSGKWEDVWVDLAGERELAIACSRYVKPSSGWTFLHQAAYAGNERAVRGLVRLGASLAVRSKENETPRDVAAKRGHAGVAALMGDAERGQNGLWAPSADSDLMPSSSSWAEARKRRAWRDLRVGYGGAVVVIPAGACYYVDLFERVLIGWHGTYDPPGGMDGESML